MHANVNVVGCGGSVLSEPDGAFRLAAAPGVTCKLVAHSADGLRRGRDWPTYVTVAEGTTVTVDVWLPPILIGTLLIVVDENLRVSHVFQGDLFQVDDRVLALNGHSVGGRGEFIDWVRRHPGEDVSLELERNGRRFQVSTPVATLEDWSTPDAVHPSRVPPNHPILEWSSDSAPGVFYGAE